MTTEPGIADLVIRPGLKPLTDMDRIWNAAESGRTGVLEGMRVAHSMLWRAAQDEANPVAHDDLASFAWLMSYLVELVNALESCQVGAECQKALSERPASE